MSHIPIYSTRGEWAAMLVDDLYIYNVDGDWIGWVAEDRKVFGVRGDYAGWLSDDNRVLRQRDTTPLFPRRTPPPIPPRIQMPAQVPLPPMLPDLRFDTIDLFDDAPHRLDPYDMGEVPDFD